MQLSKRSIFSAILGNAHEWYDFALYGYFAAIIAAQFFPAENKHISLLLSLSVFATGFIFRPFGSMVFGHFGDRYGRRRVLLFSTLLMAIPTTLIGVLPNYQHWGIVAPIVLILLRLLQGIAVSGELSGVSAYLIEHSADNRRGLAGSLIMTSVYIGQLLGSGIGFGVSYLFTAQALHTWAWRIPFLLSALLGAAIFILRYFSDESPEFEQMKSTGKLLRSPVAASFQQHSASIIHIIGLICVAAVAGYLLAGFLPTFLVANLHFTLRQALLLNTIGMVAVMLCLPIIGYLSDYLGRRFFWILACVGFMVLAYPIFYLFSFGHMGLAIIAEIIFAVIIACVNGVTTVTMAEIFPANVRQTGMGIAFNVSLAIFGGTAPLVSQFLVGHFNSYLAPAFYLMLCAFVSLGFVFRNRKF